jgi:hypothetical protein
MVNKTSNSGTKRLSKGQRTHTRRLKQEARKVAGYNNPQSSPVQTVQVRKKKIKTNPDEVD